MKLPFLLKMRVDRLIYSSCLITVLCFMPSNAASLKPKEGNNISLEVKKLEATIPSIYHTTTALDETGDKANDKEVEHKAYKLSSVPDHDTSANLSYGFLVEDESSKTSKSLSNKSHGILPTHESPVKRLSNSHSLEKSTQNLEMVYRSNAKSDGEKPSIPSPISSTHISAKNSGAKEINPVKNTPLEITRPVEITVIGKADETKPSIPQSSFGSSNLLRRIGEKNVDQTPSENLHLEVTKADTMNEIGKSDEKKSNVTATSANIHLSRSKNKLLKNLNSLSTKENVDETTSNTPLLGITYADTITITETIAEPKSSIPALSVGTHSPRLTFKKGGNIDKIHLTNIPLAVTSADVMKIAGKENEKESVIPAIPDGTHIKAKTSKTGEIFNEIPPKDLVVEISSDEISVTEQGDETKSNISTTVDETHVLHLFQTEERFTTDIPLNALPKVIIREPILVTGKEDKTQTSTLISPVSLDKPIMLLGASEKIEKAVQNYPSTSDVVTGTTGESETASSTPISENDNRSKILRTEEKGEEVISKSIAFKPTSEDSMRIEGKVDKTTDRPTPTSTAPKYNKQNHSKKAYGLGMMSKKNKGIFRVETNEHQQVVEHHDRERESHINDDSPHMSTAYPKVSYGSLNTSFTEKRKEESQLKNTSSAHQNVDENLIFLSRLKREVSTADVPEKDIISRISLALNLSMANLTINMKFNGSVVLNESYAGVLVNNISVIAKEGLREGRKSNETKSVREYKGKNMFIKLWENNQKNDTTVFKSSIAYSNPNFIFKYLKLLAQKYVQP